MQCLSIYVSTCNKWVARNFGLMVSVLIMKTKHVVTGRLVKECDQEPISFEGGGIEAVDAFAYLAGVYLITQSGQIDVKVDRWRTQA